MAEFFKNIVRNRAMLFMVLPGTLWFFFFAYLPMFGSVIAFKQFRNSHGNFFENVIYSKWIGLKNFEFLFKTEDAYIITRNTILYNIVFISLGLIVSVFMAIILSELASKRLAKLYQTGMFMPYFLSWVIVGFFSFSFLSVDFGVLNKILGTFGIEPIFWYSDAKYWPYILTFMSLWKSVGYSSVVYLAAIVGIDRSYYEAAMIDGANKWQQIRNITLPMIKPLIIMLTLLAIGRIFYADFGLFYEVPRNSGPLFPVTNVIDTFVYRGLKTTGELGMAAAAGFYQSAIGFLLVVISNYVVRKVSKENALF
ncbi:ABC transporter permease [Paenibacillus baekrokdamisoli]|uniref:ABC transporter permease n=1 Tax=Paenibacillus baekrokdamisoli TaxID=1712516 RepID=UPI000F7680CA|nr:ABC transporter permease subunit [Paenibacillus baekrokdamisoli]